MSCLTRPILPPLAATQASKRPQDDWFRPSTHQSSIAAILKLSARNIAQTSRLTWIHQDCCLLPITCGTSPHRRLRLSDCVHRDVRPKTVDEATEENRLKWPSSDPTCRVLRPSRLDTHQDSPALDLEIRTCLRLRKER